MLAGLAAFGGLPPFRRGPADVAPPSAPVAPAAVSLPDPFPALATASVPDPVAAAAFATGAPAAPVSSVVPDASAASRASDFCASCRGADAFADVDADGPRPAIPPRGAGDRRPPPAAVVVAAEDDDVDVAAPAGLPGRRRFMVRRTVSSRLPPTYTARRVPPFARPEIGCERVAAAMGSQRRARRQRAQAAAGAPNVRGVDPRSLIWTARRQQRRPPCGRQRRGERPRRPSARPAAPRPLCSAPWARARVRSRGSHVGEVSQRILKNRARSTSAAPRTAPQRRRQERGAGWRPRGRGQRSLTLLLTT